MIGDSSSPTGVILGATVVITATTVLRNAENKTKAGTTFRPVIFGFGLALALLAISMVSAGFAKGLALMSLVGAFIVNGPAVFNLIGRIGSAK